MRLLSDVKDFFGFEGYHKRDRLNLLGAAEAHVLWKTHLGHHVQGSISEPLEFALVGQDGVCQLGNWLNGSVFQDVCDSAAYKRLGDAHRDFHESGAVIVNKLKDGDRSGADDLFRNEYSQSLHQIIESLIEINRLMQAV